MAMYQRDYVRTLLENVNEAAVQIWEDDYLRERAEAENELRNREQAIAAKMMMLAEDLDDEDLDEDDDEDSPFVSLEEIDVDDVAQGDSVLVAEYKG
jgi:hypothetical protein